MMKNYDTNRTTESKDEESRDSVEEGSESPNESTDVVNDDDYVPERAVSLEDNSQIRRSTREQKYEDYLMYACSEVTEPIPAIN